MRILPGVLKELSKHVPTVLFQTVEWSELASELPKISRRMIQKEGYAELIAHQRALLGPLGITISENSVIRNSLHGKKHAGEKILQLFYTQIFSKQGLFLDLRSQNFDLQNKNLIWNPTSLWTTFGESFRQSLLKVYEGFYFQNEEIYYEGLMGIGLIQKDWSHEDKKELADIFRAQFGDATTSEMSFSLEHFQKSIIKMSDFILKKKVRVSKDFFYLGIYLVTLYSTLEETHEKFHVRDIYLNTRKEFIF